MLQLSHKQKGKIAEICKKFGAEILLLFGSQVSNKTHRESDIDLAFAADRPFNFEEKPASTRNCRPYSARGVETMDILKTNPLLKKRIFDEHQPLHVTNKFLYYQLASYAVKSYLETKALRDYLVSYLDKKYAGKI